MRRHIELECRIDFFEAYSKKIIILICTKVIIREHNMPNIYDILCTFVENWQDEKLSNAIIWYKTLSAYKRCFRCNGNDNKAKK